MKYQNGSPTQGHTQKPAAQVTPRIGLPFAVVTPRFGVAVAPSLPSQAPCDAATASELALQRELLSGVYLTYGDYKSTVLAYLSAQTERRRLCEAQAVMLDPFAGVRVGPYPGTKPILYARGATTKDEAMQYQNGSRTGMGHRPAGQVYDGGTKYDWTAWGSNPKNTVVPLAVPSKSGGTEWVFPAAWTCQDFTAAKNDYLLQLTSGQYRSFGDYNTTYSAYLAVQQYETNFCGPVRATMTTQQAVDAGAYTTTYGGNQVLVTSTAQYPSKYLPAPAVPVSAAQAIRPAGQAVDLSVNLTTYLLSVVAAGALGYVFAMSQKPAHAAASARHRSY